MTYKLSPSILAADMNRGTIGDYKRCRGRLCPY